MPSPPFPSPESAVLGVIVANAMAGIDSGELSARQAIVHAAVHAWYEGHIEGEDACPGCDYRGELNKQATRGWIDPELN